jgi:ribosomal protein L16 Arg81 hydroxylase
MATHSPHDFDRVIFPLSIAQFTATHFEREPLLLRRCKADHYRGIFSLDTLDEFLSSQALHYTRVFVVDAKRRIGGEEFSNGDGRVDVRRLYQLFGEGATLVIDRMQEYFPAIAALCRSFEQALECPFVANMYLTPANSQCFAAHHDSEDVYILQLAGSKCWRLWDPQIELPLNHQHSHGYGDEIGPPRAEITVNAGDLLYLPRGTPHEVHSRDEMSLHITLAPQVYTWSQVLMRAMEEVVMNDPSFRASLPPGFATGRIEPDVLEGKFRELVSRLAQSMYMRPAIDTIAEKFVSTRAPLLQGQCRHVFAVDALDIDDRVGARPGLIYREIEIEDSVILQCQGAEVTFPLCAAQDLAFALDTPSFRIGDMPGPLDAYGKLVLVRRLVREGLVTILDAPRLSRRNRDAAVTGMRSRKSWNAA